MIKINISGPQGAGKSVLANKLIDALVKEGYSVIHNVGDEEVGRFSKGQREVLVVSELQK